MSEKDVQHEAKMWEWQCKKVSIFEVVTNGKSDKKA